MKAVTEAANYPDQNAPHIVVHALRENKRPVGFAPWPKSEKPKKKGKEKRK